MSEIKPIRGVVLRDAMELTGATVTVVDITFAETFLVLAENGERFFVPFTNIALVALPAIVQRAHDQKEDLVNFVLYPVPNSIFHSTLIDYLRANEFSHIKPKT